MQQKNAFCLFIEKKDEVLALVTPDVVRLFLLRSQLRDNMSSALNKHNTQTAASWLQILGVALKCLRNVFNHFTVCIHYCFNHSFIHLLPLSP